MSVRLACDALYTRPDGYAMHCTYVKGHTTGAMPDHSWFGIRCLDIAEAEKVDYTPAAVQAFLDSMTRGEMDLYIEAILAVAHNRKRAQRGTAGFTHGGPTR